MLESIRKRQRWLTYIFIAVIGGVFVFFMGQGSSLRPATPTGNAVLELDDYRVEMNDYQRARVQQEERLSQAFGDQFDARKLRSFVDTQTLQMLVSNAVLAMNAEELGLRVSKEEIQNLVRQNPSFRGADGKFDAEAFKAFAQWEFGSQRNFLRVVRQDLLRQKMIQLLYNQVSVSDAEARASALQRLEQIRLAYVVLDTQALPDGEMASDEELTVYLDENRVRLTSIYEERADEFHEEDRVHAWHVLIAVDRDAEEVVVETAQRRAESARDRIASGEPFEEVAKALSEDPGTAEKGGDLGLVARGETPPELEDAVFAGVVDELGELVRTDAGFHVVRITERAEGGVSPFDDVAMDLAREEYVKAEARGRAEGQAEMLAASIRDGSSLETAAHSNNIGMERSVMFPRRPDGFIPGIGGSEDTMAAAFALTLDAPQTSRIFEVDGKLVLIELLERPPLEASEIEGVLAEERERLLTTKRGQMIDDWVNTRRDELLASGRLLVNADLVLGDG